ncbi:polyphosphate polymerase domain-containing protein [Actinospongicola halichondriae]|uniref:polyphosphate polymerase domain-containing protein n=1 Tax=Actinospongicola halichondriae TaxID=3236844 RepID=UPI003D5899BD
MTATVDAAVRRFSAIDLAELDQCAQLLTRKDRKYIVDAGILAALLEALPTDVRALETEHGRWSRYESVYFDTPRFDSFRLAATRRRNRFKVRTRRYVDPGTSMIEVKTKDRRGRTVKRRDPLDDGTADVLGTVRRFAEDFSQVRAHSDDLAPTVTTSYRRATLVLPQPHARVTLDADFRAVDVEGATVTLGDELVVETKTNGAPCLVDHLLWRAGHRPITFSKYATALAALHPDLPHNRWNRVLIRHFEAMTPTSSPPALDRDRGTPARSSTSGWSDRRPSPSPCGAGPSSARAHRSTRPSRRGGLAGRLG